MHQANRIAELSAGQQMCTVSDPAEARMPGAGAGGRVMHLQALDRLLCASLSTKPATAADSHSATIRRQLYLFKLLLFYSYVFRPHHDKTMFKLRRCKTQNLPSKVAAASIAKNANSQLERSFDNTGRQNNTKSTLLNRRNALRKCSSVFIQHNGTIIESQVQPWFHIEIHHIVSFLRCLPLAHQ